MLCCQAQSCYARLHNDLEGHRNFSSAIYSFSILCLEHHYCGDQQWRSLTEKLNPPSAFVYFRWSWSRSWSCYFGLGLKNLVLFTSLIHSCFSNRCCCFLPRDAMRKRDLCCGPVSVRLSVTFVFYPDR